MAALLFTAAMRAQAPKPSPVLAAMKAELATSMEQLKKQRTPPYFLSYEIIETETTNVSGSFGALTSSTPAVRARYLGVDLRVGEYALDNTRPIRGALFNGMDNYNYYSVPIDDDPDALRARLWYFTDQRYKRAIEQLIAVKTNVKVKAEETDKAGDFSPAKAETYSDPPSPAVHVDRTLWEDKVRRY
ncbi:MAG TPA: hypothetical protein VFE56_06335, partial [Candidatus Binataceae bacterium]|nr:hypothetical protein [Candidatus Binataceae bacterium]